VTTVYSEVIKNPEFIKQKSVEKTPSLPRDGAQRVAKKTANNSHQADFLKTPEAGIAGYAFLCDLIMFVSFFCGFEPSQCEKEYPLSTGLKKIPI
jgi:hypothetical protein